MIQDVAYWRKWESAWERKNPLNLEQAIALYDGMFEEAKILGILPGEDLLEGIELKIRLAKAINAV